MNRINSFSAISDINAKILILGSVPGVKSLEAGQFYAHPQNQFWKFMFKMFDEEYTTDYEKKKKLIIKNKIALWDVLYECEREGSMDANIKNASVNDIEGFLAVYKNVRHIYCNGKTAYKYFKKYIKTDVECILLPSTSPANAMLKFEDKYAIWRDNIKEGLR